MPCGGAVSRYEPDRLSLDHGSCRAVASLEPSHPDGSACSSAFTALACQRAPAL